MMTTGTPATASRSRTLLARIDLSRAALLTLRPPLGKCKKPGVRYRIGA